MLTAPGCSYVAIQSQQAGRPRQAQPATSQPRTNYILWRGVDHFCVELYLSTLSIQRFCGAAGSELLSYTESRWLVSHDGDIFRRFLLPIR